MWKPTLVIAVLTVLVALVGCKSEKDTDEPGAAALAPPKIDGKLDDAFWAKAQHVIEMTKLQDGEKASVRTVARIATDEKNLYLAVECFDDADTLKNLIADITDHDVDGIWTDDEIELFIDPTNERESYYQIIVNCKGVWWDAYHEMANDPDLTWEPKIQVKTVVGPKSWVVELALPLSAFTHTQKTGPKWAVNILRNRTASSELIYSTPTKTDTSHSPEQFGTLDGMPEIELKPKE